MGENHKQINSLPEEFASYKEAAEFWDTHDTTDFIDDFETIEAEVNPNTTVSR